MGPCREMFLGSSPRRPPHPSTSRKVRGRLSGGQGHCGGHQALLCRLGSCPLMGPERQSRGRSQATLWHPEMNAPVPTACTCVSDRGCTRDEGSGVHVELSVAPSRECKTDRQTDVAEMNRLSPPAQPRNMQVLTGQQDSLASRCRFCPHSTEQPTPRAGCGKPSPLVLVATDSSPAPATCSPLLGASCGTHLRPRPLAHPPFLPGRTACYADEPPCGALPSPSLPSRHLGAAGLADSLG